MKEKFNEMYSVKDLFLELIRHDTTADDNNNTSPSTSVQIEFAKILVTKCNEIGLSNVTLTETGYVYAELPANFEVSGENKIPVIGFIAHVDTSPACSGKDIKADVVQYNGGNITLANALVISQDEFPHLKNYVGDEIIVTDGNTLLGADDKAGIAEILTAMDYLIKNPDIKHGTIKLGFTPDEEIGRGADHFDVKYFGANFAYTIDGGEIGELEYESFNAAGAKFIINGKSVHPGYAKDIMVNSVLIANDLINMFPLSETPQTTAGYEGFYHVDEIKGNVEKTVINMIIRDFDKENFNKRKDYVLDTVLSLNQKYNDRIILNMYDQYFNMREVLEDKTEIINLAKQAMIDCGVEPKIRAIRGGTDGARLSFNKLPCPNIFAGGHNFHGPYEYVPVGSLVKACSVIVRIAELAVK